MSEVDLGKGLLQVLECPEWVRSNPARDERRIAGQESGMKFVRGRGHRREDGDGDEGVTTTWEKRKDEEHRVFGCVCKERLDAIHKSE